MNKRFIRAFDWLCWYLNEENVPYMVIVLVNTRYIVIRLLSIFLLNIIYINKYKVLNRNKFKFLLRQIVNVPYGRSLISAGPLIEGYGKIILHQLAKNRIRYRI